MPPPQILINSKNNISALQPGKQAIAYTVNNWNRYFSSDKLFNNVTATYPGQIRRKDLFKMAANLQSNYNWNNLRELFLSIMLWGFGTTGYGAYRTKAMVTDNNFRRTIEICYHAIAKDNISQAYNAFQLNMCGSAFFTKYFYFSMPRNGIKLMPLILDAVVARSLEERCNLNISRYAKVARNKKKNNQI